MNVYLPARLPSAYQEVEYIQSSWTQYIDTGLLVKPNTKVQIDMQLTSVATNIRYFAVETGDNNSWWVAFVIYLDSNKQISFANGNWSVLRTGRNWDTSRYTFVANNSSLKIYSNGTNVYTGNAPWTRTTNSANNLYLLADDNNWTATLFSSAKLYSCKMYEASTLVRDFIPCYRKSDNVIGMYDLVNNQFYTNSWTGTFSKGNDVTMSELKNAYIGNWLS